MFYRLIIENFRSFGQTVQFDMFPNLKRENLKNHVYPADSNIIAAMKLAAIYGSNGAGKSNLYKAFEFIKSFCSVFNDKLNISEWYKKNIFMLPIPKDNPSIAFLIEFSKNDLNYILNIELDGNGVKREELLVSGMGKTNNQRIYLRQYDKIIFNGITISKQIREIIERQLNSFKNSSFIALNGELKLVNDMRLGDCYDWFLNDVVLLSYYRNIPQLIDMLSKNDDLMAFVNTVFSNVGLGLKELDVKNVTFEEWYADLSDDEKQLFSEGKLNVDANHGIIKMHDDRPIASITNEDGLKIVKELLFRQLGKNGYVGDMSVESQSNGTIKLLILMPVLFKLVNEDVLVVVDEFDNCLHPKLLKGIIKYIGEKQTCGQLVFTTHEDYLLDQHEVLRPDEIWIVDKKDSISQLYSLNEFNLHKTLSIQKGYLDDRFGGTPDINLISSM